MVLPQLLAELICQGLLFGLFGGTGSSSKPSTTLATPEKRRTQQANMRIRRLQRPVIQIH